MMDSKALRTSEHEGLDATYDPSNILIWTGMISGLRETVWEGGRFKVELQFNDSYPFQPPRIKFLKPVPFHPNIGQDGDICVDLLGKQWDPTSNILWILGSLQYFLITPNPESTLNDEAGNLYKTDRKQYDKMVRQSVLESLMS
jgi:ubiquitin-conjugating enzyme E2 A